MVVVSNTSSSAGAKRSSNNQSYSGGGGHSGNASGGGSSSSSTSSNIYINSHSGSKYGGEVDGHPETMDHGGSDAKGESALMNSGGLEICMGVTYDILDDNERWYAADVVKMDLALRRVYVQFINFESHYDTWIYDIDRRIAPQHTHTFYPGGPVRVGQAVQCRDSTDKWLAAFVKGVQGDDIEVHYKGFVAAYDEFVTRDRILPLNIITRLTVKMGGAMQGKRLFRNPASSMYTSDSKHVRHNNDSSFKSKNSMNSDEDNDRYNDSENSHPNIHNRSNNDYDSSMDDDSRKRILNQNTTPYERYVYTLSEHRLQVVRVDGDGNCLFRSISHQIYGDDRYHDVVRQGCMDYMEANADFFSQFIEGGLEMFPMYVEYKRRDACWGDDPEIQAMCEIYGRPAEIWAYDNMLGAKRLRTFHEGGLGRYVTPMRVSYYGGGHYDSIYSDSGDTRRGYVSEVGQLERAALQRVRGNGAQSREPGVSGMDRGRRGDSASFASPDIASQKPGYAEDEAFNLAIQLSRQSWVDANNMDLDSAFMASNESKDTQSSLQGSVRNEDADIQEAIVRSREEEMKTFQDAIDESRVGNMNTLVEEDAQIQQALQLSMEDESLNLALVHSLEENTKFSNFAALDFSQLGLPLVIEPSEEMVKGLLAKMHDILGMYAFTKSDCADALRSNGLDEDRACNYLIENQQLT